MRALRPWHPVPCEPGVTRRTATLAEGRRMLRGRARVALLLVAWLWSPLASNAQTLSNAGTGTSGGVALDPTNSTVTLTRQLVPGVASTAEIAPSQVIAGTTGIVFTWDILPVVLVGDPVLDRISLTAPAGYAGLSVLSVTVGGQALASQCPNPG